MFHVVDKWFGGGNKKNQRKTNQTQCDQSGCSSSEADMFSELMEGVMDKMRCILEVDTGSIQCIQEDGTGTQAKSKGPARGGGARGRTAAETRRNDETQGETYANPGGERRISTRDRGSEETGRNDEGTRKQDQGKSGKTSQSKMTIGFGRYMGRTCESMYKKDPSYCELVRKLDTRSKSIIEFQEFIEMYEEECRDAKREELKQREARLEENRKTAELEMEERQRMLQQT